MNQLRKLKRAMNNSLVHTFLGALVVAAPANASDRVAIDHSALKPALLKFSDARDAKVNSEHSSPDHKNDWVCPMHPEIHKHEPGKCPVCKMKLIKAKPKSA